MSEVLFYHLQSRPLQQILPILLERSLVRGWRALLLAGSEARVEEINAQLWTFREDSFLPHGSSQDGNAASQPIYLTAKYENPNRANVLFLVDGADCEHIAEFHRCVDLFDGNDAEALEAARDRYRRAQADGHSVTYWRQNADGNWQQQN